MSVQNFAVALNLTLFATIRNLAAYDALDAASRPGPDTPEGAILAHLTSDDMAASDFPIWSIQIGAASKHTVGKLEVVAPNYIATVFTQDSEGRSGEPIYLYAAHNDAGELVAVRQALPDADNDAGELVWLDQDTFDEIELLDLSQVDDDDNADEDADDDAADNAAPPTDAFAGLFDTKAAKTKGVAGRKAVERLDAPPIPSDKLTPDQQKIVTEAGQAIKQAREAQAVAQAAARAAQAKIASLRAAASAKLPSGLSVAEATLMVAKATRTTINGEVALAMSHYDEKQARKFSFTVTPSQIIAHKANRPADAVAFTREVAVMELYDQLIIAPLREARDVAKEAVSELEGYRLNDNLPGGAVKNVVKRGQNPRKVKKPRKISSEIAQQAAANFAAVFGE